MNKLSESDIDNIELNFVNILGFYELEPEKIESLVDTFISILQEDEEISHEPT